MRLIDADEIKYGRLNFYSDGGIPYYKDYVEKLDIDSMPTIDAVPVEFIEQEKALVQNAIFEKLKRNETAHAKILGFALQTLDVLISNWNKQMGTYEIN